MRHLILFTVSILMFFSCKKDQINISENTSCSNTPSEQICEWQKYFDYINSFKESDTTDGFFYYNIHNPAYCLTFIQNTSGPDYQFLVDATTGVKTSVSIPHESVRPKIINGNQTASTENRSPIIYDYISGIITPFNVQVAGEYLFFLPNAGQTKNLIFLLKDEFGNEVSEWRLLDPLGSELSISSEFKNIGYTHRYKWFNSDIILFSTNNSIVSYNTVSQEMVNVLDHPVGDPIIGFNPISSSSILVQQRNTSYKFNLLTQEATDYYNLNFCGPFISVLTYNPIDQRYYGFQTSVYLDTTSTGTLNNIITHNQAFSTSSSAFQIENLPF